MKVTTCDVCRGACCECFALLVPRQSSDPTFLDWAETRSIAREGDQLLFPSRCGHLTADGRCDIQEDKPKACADFQVGGPECLWAMAIFRPQLLEG